ncbi:LOW QUALITY PROTEIN: relaxin-3 [Sturnira hondurensis]|uniref:LOW QUALITY PROTEIN: relaxin-3 n=1 Tax=Sturnira hondurensis TaxID=192404 RepID=UPI001879348C|nr:LOW QUALITY PROTEIN: relaxin-3 [Sturnira hondurensis]
MLISPQLEEIKEVTLFLCNSQHPMLLLLAVWVLVWGLWLEAEALEPPDVQKLCGREFVRTAIYICGQPQLKWSQSAILTPELMGEVVGDQETETQRSKFTCSGLYKLDWCLISLAPKYTFLTMRSSINKE